ncbi:hypothetical protein [Rhodovulum sp.]|nr:hypothetical protein [Rhodovulum sp.]
MERSTTPGKGTGHQTWDNDTMTDQNPDRYVSFPDSTAPARPTG